MEETDDLNELPDEIVRHVVSFLSYEDIANLSMTCNQMKRILPTFKFIKGPIINEGDYEERSQGDGPRWKEAYVEQHIAAWDNQADSDDSR